MAKKTILYRSSEHMGRKGFADFLRRIADKAEAGAVAFKAQQGDVQADIPDSITVEVKLTEKEKAKGKKVEIEIEADWYKDGAEADGIDLA